MFRISPHIFASFSRSLLFLSRIFSAPPLHFEDFLDMFNFHRSLFKLVRALGRQYDDELKKRVKYQTLIQIELYDIYC